MVHYPVPKYITKTALSQARDFAFSDANKQEGQVAVVTTCMRCAQNLCRLPNNYDRPESRRCKHCVAGNRGAYTLVPNELNGRLNRLYQLRDHYLATIAAAPASAIARRADANIQRTGLKFARCQKQFNLELYNRRRIAAHSGTPMGMAT
ncbi:hypothetical protein DPSP01_014628 [Paraphaeosphaeria sporulosa]